MSCWLVSVSVQVSCTEPLPVVELCLGFAPGHCLGIQESLLLPPPYCPFCPPASSSKLHYQQSFCVTLITACTHCVILVCTGVTWIHHRKDSPPSWNPQSSFFWQGKWPTALREGWCLSSFFFFPLLFQHICFHLPYHCVWMHTHLWHCCHPDFIFPHKTSVVNFLELSRKPCFMQEYPILLSWWEINSLAET